MRGVAGLIKSREDLREIGLLLVELAGKTRSEHVRDLFRFGLPGVAGLIKSREDLMLLVELAGKTRSEHVLDLFEYGLPAFAYLVNTPADLRVVFQFLVKLVNEIKYQDIKNLFKYGFLNIKNQVKNINDLDKINRMLPELIFKSHALYRKQAIEEDESFFRPETTIVRRQFEKTGSETILLGGKLVGKAIIRIIAEPAFLAWKKAFEARKVWAEEGFDYIPIEPILTKNKDLRAYKTKKGNTYRVYTKVLGMTLNNFLDFTSDDKLKQQLESLRNRIMHILDAKLQILHGHLHNSNFCVEIQDDKIRLYAIDFDQAISL